MSRRWWVGVAALACVVAGCGGGDGGDPGGESTPSVTVSESPTAPSTTGAAGAAAPTLPPEAEGEDGAAAEAFVQHFWRMVNFAERTGETDELVGLATESCDACRGGAEGIQDIHGSGGTITGGDVTVESADVVRLSGSRSAFAVTADLSFAPQVIRVPGSPPERFDGGPGTYRFIVERHDGRWLVARWDAMS